ncbi:MAG: hypothetical protein UW11_C0025G0017, partial [Parcubacteria group bacterium GW2011_GWA2_43_9b]
MFQLIPNERRFSPIVEVPKIERKNSHRRFDARWLIILRRAMVFLALATLAVFLIHSASAINQDLGRHLKMGEIIWQTGHVPITNLFSYTNPNFAFIN